MTWPDDADGEVLRRLSETGLDFSQVISIDFNIDFENWPPSVVALDDVSRAFPEATISLEDGYALVKLKRLLTYDLVTSVQARLSNVTAEHGGRCESWGVLIRPREH